MNTLSSQRRRRIVFSGILTLGVIVAVFVSANTGQVDTSLGDVWGELLARLGISTDARSTDPVVSNTLGIVRFPRVLIGVAVGAALAVCGAIMQATFRNPLAEPGVVGISAGAALGAAVAIAAGITALGGWTVAGFAFLGALAATAVVRAVGGNGSRMQAVDLLLAGIAVNAFCGAGIAFLLFSSNAASREQIVFWQLGSLNGSRWSEAWIVVAVMVGGVAVAWLLARQYDLLALGDANARHLGVNVDRLRTVSIVLVAALTGAAIAFAGIIAFVGLVVPHIVRMAIGPRHRGLIAASAVGGALLLVLADLVARTAVAGADLPIGMVTSLIGGPFFFYLLIKQRRTSSGWLS